jgi:hypothetical protein
MTTTQTQSFVNLAYTEVSVKTTNTKPHLIFRDGECIDIVWAAAHLTRAQILDEVRYQMYDIPFDEDLSIHLLN